MEKNKIIIIPTFNELRSIKRVIRDCPNSWNILVVDDASSDGTNLWLRKKKISFLLNKKNQGYERSLIRGFKQVIKNKKIRYLATMDADGEHNPKYLKKMINHISKKNLDMVISERNSYNRLSEALVGKIFKLKYGIKDPLSGYKVYKVSALKKIIKNIKTNSFLVDIICKFNSLSKKLGVINSQSRQRIFGRPKVGFNLFVNIKIILLLRLIF
tara:strand:+ start:785 stop:1426 length:642 start_codon:yes stop_codon:yes gene_type:complete